jgi:hypothetical protein
LRTARERALLETVGRSGGQWSTRDIDFEVNRAVPPGDLHVLDELKVLESEGLVRRLGRSSDASRVGWVITAEGEERLRDR